MTVQHVSLSPNASDADAGAGNINANPLLVNTAYPRDYRLQSTSPVSTPAATPAANPSARY